MEKRSSSKEDQKISFTIAHGPQSWQAERLKMKSAVSSTKNQKNRRHAEKKQAGKLAHEQSIEFRYEKQNETSDSETFHGVEQKLGLTEALAAETDLIIAVEKRLPLEVINALIEQGLQEKEIYALVVPRRTLQHRRVKRERLSVEESDRAVRVARIATLAERVFGDTGAAMRWLRTTKKRFMGRSAMEMVSTETGSRLVEEMLYQIDEGMAA
jgi:putative toxin-antitoxin system antitoxin component (TIGR02293 family)